MKHALEQTQTRGLPAQTVRVLDHSPLIPRWPRLPVGLSILVPEAAVRGCSKTAFLALPCLQLAYRSLAWKSFHISFGTSCHFPSYHSPAARFCQINPPDVAFRLPVQTGRPYQWLSHRAASALRLESSPQLVVIPSFSPHRQHSPHYAYTDLSH
ncbi:hypothetical protein BDV96DRAFT_563309 [Lophiotrema nucula]|uniref:Uncharacterized protein n=1 Tax=Lophiotrema nucula TaxID=690887 RepID=A0A6A5ZU66_9PLEO|nr:hypothetical protein BDV96DRAFT_563309 [Lophiotrema nucula]